MRVVQWSSDIPSAGDPVMARARLTLVITDLKSGEIMFSSGALSASELVPLRPMMVELAAARRVRDEPVAAPGSLPTFIAGRDMVSTPTVGRLVHVDLERQVALWELDSRRATTRHPSTSPFVDEVSRQRGSDRPRRIVCVDNDPDGLEVLRLTLAPLPGVEFAAATTGRDGLALMHQSRPALLLIDLQLPDLSGATIIELCRRSAALAAVPIVVLTADASIATRRAIESFGVAHLAVKPFDLVELRVVVEHLLARD